MTKVHRGTIIGSVERIKFTVFEFLTFRLLPAHVLKSMLATITPPAYVGECRWNCGITLISVCTMEHFVGSIKEHGSEDIIILHDGNMKRRDTINRKIRFIRLYDVFVKRRCSLGVEIIWDK